MDNDDLKEKGLEVAATAVAGPEAGMAVKAANKYKQSKDKFESVKTGASRFNNGFNDSLTRNRNKQLSDEEMRKTLGRVRERQTNKVAKEKIVKGLNTYMPTSGLGDKAERELKTESGEEKLLDAYQEGDSEQEKIANVAKELEKNQKIKKIILATLPILLPLLAIMILAVVVFKNADTQIFSNQNGGTVQSEYYEFDNVNTNIFANYPGLYEKIISAVKTVSDETRVDVDKYLILATLLAPIDNGLVTPVKREDITTNNACGEDLCYKYNGEYKTWNDFVKMMGDSTELLAKMQVLTYTNEGKCKSNKKDMETYSYNDDKEEHLAWWEWLNPVRWFTGYTKRVDAEKNYVCTGAPNGESKVPVVRVLSIEEGIYTPIVNSSGETIYQKDSNSGGVYFWNLVGKDGFLFTYLKDYLYDAEDEKLKNLSNDELYEKVLPKILKEAEYIYSYYSSIRRDCNGFPVMTGELEKIDFQEDGSSPIYTLDFEDAFVGGSVLATYGGATGEVAKAQAIITRSEAYNFIEHGGKTIVGSAKMGCWWWKYNPTYDPEIGIVQLKKGDPGYDDTKDPSIPQYKGGYDPDYPKIHFPEIYKAVTETRGIVVTEYGGYSVLETEYDAFCPVTREPQNGFYYLPDGQRNLPIDTSRFRVSKTRVECPCFQNNSSQPGTQYAEKMSDLYDKLLGKPPQTTTENCWEPSGDSKVDDEGNVLSGFKYHATGGHGRGVSQHGMAYFSQFGYDYQGLLKLFLERDNYGISFKRYEGSILPLECTNYLVVNK